MKIYHSRDGGKTWDEIEVKEHSIVALQLSARDDIPYTYDDGYGNLYRKELPGD